VLSVGALLRGSLSWSDFCQIGDRLAEYFWTFILPVECGRAPTSESMYGHLMMTAGTRIEADSFAALRNDNKRGSGCFLLRKIKSCHGGWRMAHLDLWLALGVVVSTAATDAVYVMFNAAVSAQRRVPAATWSSVWYLLSAFAVISYTKNWVYVCFAAAGSWIGAYLSMTLLRRAKGARGPEAV
jgi:hypothetical protein